MEAHNKNVILEVKTSEIVSFQHVYTALSDAHGINKSVISVRLLIQLGWFAGLMA